MSIDSTAQRLFESLQKKIEDATLQLEAVGTQTQSREREKRIQQATVRELRQLEAGTSVYLSVGKMFMKNDLDSTVADIEADVKSNEELLQGLGKKKIYLEKQLSDATNHLRDLIHLGSQQQ